MVDYRHCQHIEYDKIPALKSSQGNFDTPCPLSTPAIEKLKWWENKILNSSCAIKSYSEIYYVIHTDVNTKDLGAHDNTQTINGRWSDWEAKPHMNVLEPTAIKFAIRSFLPLKQDIKHVRIMKDNNTSVPYINKQGGVTSMTCNDIATKIWEFCI